MTAAHPDRAGNVRLVAMRFVPDEFGRRRASWSSGPFGLGSCLDRLSARAVAATVESRATTTTTPSRLKCAGSALIVTAITTPRLLAMPDTSDTAAMVERLTIWVCDRCGQITEWTEADGDPLCDGASIEVEGGAYLTEEEAEQDHKWTPMRRIVVVSAEHGDALAEAVGRHRQALIDEMAPYGAGGEFTGPTAELWEALDAYRQATSASIGKEDR